MPTTTIEGQGGLVFGSPSGLTLAQKVLGGTVLGSNVTVEHIPAVAGLQVMGLYSPSYMHLRVWQALHNLTQD